MIPVIPKNWVDSLAATIELEERVGMAIRERTTGHRSDAPKDAGVDLW